MELPTTAFSRAVAPLLGAIERLTGWLWLVLLAIIILNVSARQLLGEGFIQFEELQWHLYAAGFLFGIACACKSDAHVRVDVLREGWSPRTRAWIDLYGILLLLLPFILLVIVYGIPFAYSSFVSGEISQSPGGLPWRWIPKALLPLAFIFLLLAALARLSEVAAFLFRNPPQAEGARDAR
jgi:TRAP-type mannitol/chloroaromatic compound transport system permease small subunit